MTNLHEVTMPTNFEPTKVNESGLTALIQNLGRDCSPTQFLREFTKNSIEACLRTGLPKRQIIVDFDNDLYRDAKLYKLSFIDNGDGMTQDDMVKLLNSLSSSGPAANLNQNYGVGAKISALTRNHAGIYYKSWKGSRGHAVLIKYNDDARIYGIQGVDCNGRTIKAPSLNENNKPKLIEEHGTQVTLWGMTEDQDTMQPPPGVTGARDSWLVLYLNSRFFRIPENIDIQARIGYYRDNNPRHNYLSKIVGQNSILDQHSDLKGSLRVTDANIFWWVIQEGADGHGRELLKGHTALVNQDEIFDVSDARSSRITYFGVIYGRDRVVIYVEPDHAVQNTSRTSLVKSDGSPLNWDVWQDEFREKMPLELKSFLDALIEKNSRDSHDNSIRERLKSLRELFKLSRYKAAQNGHFIADPNSEAQFGTAGFLTGERTDKARQNLSGRGSTPGSIATALLSQLVQEGENGVEAIKVEPDPFPKVQWTNEHDSPQLVDRGAEYVPSSNLILANTNFSGVRDVIEYFSRTFQDSPDYLAVIKEVVHEAFAQVLTECVAGACSLKNRPRWSEADYTAAVSKEALTTVVMQRYWMVSHVRRILGSKIRGFNDMTTSS